jgi:hypothetical protein
MCKGNNKFLWGAGWRVSGHGMEGSFQKKGPQAIGLSRAGDGLSGGALDVASIGVERNDASCVAERADSHKGLVHGGEHIDRACCEWKVWKREVGCVHGVHQLLVRYLNGEGFLCWLEIGRVEVGAK